MALLTPTQVEAGTHLSDRGTRFDDAPTEGWILAGLPFRAARSVARTS